MATFLDLSPRILRKHTYINISIFPDLLEPLFKLYFIYIQTACRNTSTNLLGLSYPVKLHRLLVS